MSSQKLAHLVVIGWAGCAKRHLRRIRESWEERGFEPIVLRPDAFSALRTGDGMSKVGDSIWADLRDRLAADEAPLIIHAFSNNGFWSLAATLESAQRHGQWELLNSRLAGVVLDSSPGLRLPLEVPTVARFAAKAGMPSLLRSLGRTPASSHPVLTPIAESLATLWAVASREQLRFIARGRRKMSRLGSWPILMLYGEADDIVTAEEVRDFARAAREHGHPVQERCWADSGHVRHFLDHRDEYLREVDGFVTDAFARYERELAGMIPLFDTASMTQSAEAFGPLTPSQAASSNSRSRRAEA